MATSATPFPSSSDMPPESTGYGGTTGTSTGRSTDHGTPLTGDSASSSAALSDGMPRSTTAHSDLLNRVVQGAHETIDRLADSAAPHVQRLQEGVATANDTLHARAGQMRETGDEWAESLRSTVRENPLAAVATALAVGLIVARLTRR
jgi:ElaB/YqjD/DUF883 family membrane-anchored ribosome-binding protein